MKLVFSFVVVTFALMTVGCSSDSGSGDGEFSLGDFGTSSSTDGQTCSLDGEISGEVDQVLNRDIDDGCGGAATSDGELITAFGGLTVTPGFKIWHENFQPGIVADNRTAHVEIIYSGAIDNRRWETALAACTINITSSEQNGDGEVKVSGSGTCASPALPDTNSGAVSNITIEPFTFESAWLRWP